MKTSVFKTLAVSAVLLACMGFSAMAGALVFRGETLGASLVAADVWVFNCATGTAKAQVRVTDGTAITNSLIAVYVTLGKDGNPNPLPVFDTENTTTQSNWAINADGVGEYAIVVNKSSTRTGTEDYVVEAQCLNSLNQIIGPTATAVFLRVDQ